MQDDYETPEKKVFNKSYFLQKCIKVEEFYDYEFGTEFFLLAPKDINDMYNQN